MVWQETERYILLGANVGAGFKPAPTDNVAQGNEQRVRENLG